MRKIFCFIAVMAGICTVSAQDAGGVHQMEGSFLEQLQQRDSVLVADQLRYGFRLEGVEEGAGFALPDYSKGFRDSVEVVSAWSLDTLDFKKGKKGAPGSYDIEGSIVITSFDEGEYPLPPIALLRHSAAGEVDTLVFNPQTLHVKTIPVDTATFQIHDIKGQIRYPVTFMEILPYLLGGLLFAAAVVLIVIFFIRRRKILSGGLRREPAHIVALRKLDHLRGSKLWAPEKQKAFYSGVTDTLREYIAERYGVSAMEMTTKEIFDSLTGKDLPADLYAEAKELFERADFVKFAKYIAADEENASAVPVAVRFVTQTYQSELDAEAPGDTEGQKQPELPKAEPHQQNIDKKD